MTALQRGGEGVLIMHPVAFVSDCRSQIIESGLYSWSEIETGLTTPSVGKKDGHAWVPAKIEIGPRTTERVESNSALSLDVESRSKAVRDENDDPVKDKHGDIVKKAIGPEPPSFDGMVAELSLHGLRCVAHTTYSHNGSILPEGIEHPRYRLTFPLSRSLRPDEVRPLGLHVAGMLGLSDCIDTSALEPARLLYTPRCPNDRLHLFRSAVIDGKPLDVDVLLAEARKIEQAQKATLAKRHTGQACSVIQAYNAQADIGQSLERSGYIKKGRGRYMHPSSTTGQAGVRLLPGDRQTVYSSHGGDPLNDGHAHDAFDVYRILEHNKDMKRAVKEAAQLLGMTLTDGKKRDTGSDFADIVPCDAPVDLNALLDTIVQSIHRFIVCNPETGRAAALWIAMTWVIDYLKVAPLAVIWAAEMRCGKTLLLSLMQRLVKRPLPASNISPAAVYRAIEAWQPTLMVDEADAFLRDNEELRGILNSGHTRDSAFVIRTVGEDHTPKKFSTWGCKAISGIGQIQPTLMDRAIPLELRRKKPAEQVERLRHAEDDLFEQLTSQLARFAVDYGEQIGKARPKLPEYLNDRAQDNWEPLLAIADAAGGDWPEKARADAKKISGGSVPAQSAGNELLGDIRELFEKRCTDRLGTSELIEKLCADDEAPWATYNRGRPITPRQVAKKLNDYGIGSNTIRIGVSTQKGYLLKSFADAFERYLTPPPASVTPSQPAPDQHPHVTGSSPVTVTPSVSVTPKPAPDGACDGVTDKHGVQTDYVEEIF